MANFRISDLTAVSAYADTQEFEVNDSGTSKKITGTQLKAGILDNPTVTGDMNFGDSEKALFGASSDLQIYHDGSNSLVREVGAGNLLLQGDASVRVQNGAGTDTSAVFVPSSFARLNYANAVKLETTSTGIDVTGTVTADGLTATGDTLIGSYALDVDTTNTSVGIAMGASTVSGRKLSVNGNIYALGNIEANNGDITTNGSLTVARAITEGVYNLTGTSLDPNNGTIQTKTLSANTTLTDNLSAGESITLMIDDGSAYTITWPTMTWVNNAGTAPTLATTGYTVVALWKVSTTLYGALVGDGS